MGDGNKLGTVLILKSQSFSFKECTLIISVFIYKFGLDCNIYMQRNLPVIYISGKSMIKLAPKIKPYFIPSMLYILHTWKNKTKFN